MPRIDRPTLRRAVAVGSATLTLAIGWTGVPHAGADEAPPPEVLVVAAHTEVVVDPARQRTDTTISYEFVNDTTDESIVNFFETLPWDAEDVTIEVGGEQVQGVSAPASDGFAEWLVLFPESLDPGERLTVSLQWGRSEQRSLPVDGELVSAALISLVPYAVGDLGPSTLTVVVPESFTAVDVGPLVAEPTQGDGFLRFTAELAPYEAVTFVVEDNAGLVRVPVDDPTGMGLDVTLSSLQTIDGWLQPDLTEMIGRLAAWMPAEVPAPVEIRQGWTGSALSRLAADGAVVLPPDVEPWIALQVVADRWLADLPIDEPDFTHAVATSLARTIAGDSGFAPEQASRARWLVTTDLLLPAVGADGWAAVIGALEERTNPYRGATELAHPRPADWRTLVDVFEIVGGAADASDAFRLSITSDQSFELDQRATAVLDYRALEGRAAPWTMPAVLREPLAAWDFATFFALQASVSDLIGARDELALVAEDYELDPGDFVRDAFESAGVSMDDAWTIHVAQREALELVGEARRMAINDQGLLSRIGMIGADVDGKRERMMLAWNGGEFGSAAHQAEELAHEIEGAVGRGTLRLLVPFGGVILLVSLFRAFRRRRLVDQPNVDA